MLVKERKRCAQEVAGVLERTARDHRELRMRSADAERAAAERSLDRTNRVTKGRPRHVVMEDEVDLIFGWSPMGCRIDDDCMGDRVEGWFGVEPFSQLGAMCLGQRFRATGGERPPRRIRRNRQVAIELCRLRDAALEDPGFTLFSACHPEAPALQVTD